MRANIDGLIDELLMISALEFWLGWWAHWMTGVMSWLSSSSERLSGTGS